MQIKTDQSRVLAILGPTNTGKTHFAMERMLGHASGMIGFPLRLLARENYDRAVAIKGKAQVALITGEEKIVPPRAKYFLCTVESMPLDRQLAFVGIDEIQLCADPDRGHIFTDRLLYARGTEETVFMGAETIRPIIKTLVPETEFETRPRFSSLTYIGQKKVNRLAARSCVVSFSAADVYATAELVRRQRGGAAVVLGALSPRTRNAQVEMYQSGEVDYLVATDAIGMGLNMDLDHVAFAATHKFDGRHPRPLTPPEMAQIAGRAGRHMNDGTFGTTADIGPLDEEMVDRIEGHRFQDLKTIFWRNPDLRFTSVEVLQKSLRKRPEDPGLVRAREADDELALMELAQDEDVIRTATSPDRVKMLWEVCRIPDFGKHHGSSHANLLKKLYKHLINGEKRLPDDWIRENVTRLDRTDGDIDHLIGRIAHIRTWTYIAYHGAWLENAGDWQIQTRAIEDKLSDALHQKLTQRFVDKRTSVLVKKLKDKETMKAELTNGEVRVEGEFVGHLEGFRFSADKIGKDAEARAITGAAHKALRGEILNRVALIEQNDGSDLRAELDGRITWKGEQVARLAPGDDVLRPDIEVLSGELMESVDKERVRKKLADWLKEKIETSLPSLFKANEAEVPGTARAIIYQLTEALGNMPRFKLDEQIGALSRDDRRALRKAGVRIGRSHVYLPGLLKPAAVATRGLLWVLQNKPKQTPVLPPEGRVSIPITPEMSRNFLHAVGYRTFKTIALRLDMLERISELAWAALEKERSFVAGPDFLSLAGCGHDEMDEILNFLGFHGKMMKKPEPKPEEPSTEKTDEAASEETPAEQKPDATPEDASDETATETPATAPEEEIPAADPAQAATPEEAPKENEPADKVEGEPDMEFRYTLKPRRRHPQKNDTGDHKKGPKGKGHKGKGGKGKGGPKGKGGKQPDAKDKPIDPDSPFAKLAGLLDKK